MKYITTTEMYALEIDSEYYGVSTFDLMKKAGEILAHEIQNREKIGSAKISAVCGSGNNAGDAYVAAELLAQNGADVTIYVLSEPKKKEAKNAYSEIKNCKIVTQLDEKELVNSDVIIDGLFGTGIRGTIREPYSVAIELMNKSNAKKYSVDIPSGLNPDTGEYSSKIDSDYIITFHAPKIGLKNERNVICVDIGIPQDAIDFTGPGDIFKVQNIRSTETHKGENGRLLIIGGSIDYAGAPALSGLAALRTGTDLVTIATPEKVALAINELSADLITKKLSGNYLNEDNVDTLFEIEKSVDCLLIGPGLGQHKETKNALLEYIANTSLKKVIDADALKLIPNESLHDCIVTPHAKEFEALFKKPVPKEIEEKKEIVKDVAESNKVVLLKGSIDIISNGTQTKLNKTGNPGMSVGGTGDVLAGLCAGFLSKNADLFNCACAAAFTNGSIGDILEKTMGYNFIASDIVDNIPRFLASQPFNENRSQ